MQLKAFCASLEHYPLLQNLDISKIVKFARYCTLARPSIEAGTSNIRIPPDTISVHTQILLGEVIGKDVLVIRELWSALKGQLWQLSISGDDPHGIVPTAEEIKCFNTFTLPLSTSYWHLYPPTRVCTSPGCENYREVNDILTLTEPLTHRAALFILHQGTLPIFTTSLLLLKM
ncbi:hypothetical protein D9613_006164 [Agrocybe pediades]|uniref:Uncharacterized protein n=1 Tax=Agrocybe pediades TaxID=84607 RepID=A0A8H4VRL7_9AGAR|nr:hypothetical protein D9613_006164 [Agrocybe pediades]